MKNCCQTAYFIGVYEERVKHLKPHGNANKIVMRGMLNDMSALIDTLDENVSTETKNSAKEKINECLEVLESKLEPNEIQKVIIKAMERMYMVLIG